MHRAVRPLRVAARRRHFSTVGPAGSTQGAAGQARLTLLLRVSSLPPAFATGQPGGEPEVEKLGFVRATGERRLTLRALCRADDRLSRIRNRWLGFGVRGRDIGVRRRRDGRPGHGQGSRQHSGCAMRAAARCFPLGLTRPGLCTAIHQRTLAGIQARRDIEVMARCRVYATQQQPPL